MLSNLSHLSALVTKIVKDAGKIIKENWSKQHQIHHKGSIDLVTETDFATQNYLKEHLLKLLPDTIFIGEEGTDLTELPKQIKKLSWIVDPVDGTTNFVHRIPYVAISVALCEAGKPLLGVVYAPILEECFSAVKNCGAFLNEQPIQCSATSSLIDALIATGTPYESSDNLNLSLKQNENILASTQGLRRLGSAALHLAYLACGRLDGFYESGLKPWDIAAGLLLVAEAGGKISDYDNKPFQFMNPILATNTLLHEDLSKLLKSDL